MDIRDRSCRSKRRYDLPARARDAAARTSPRHRHYRCPLCRGWHVGRPPTMDALEQLALAIRGLDAPRVVVPGRDAP